MWHGVRGICIKHAVERSKLSILVEPTRIGKETWVAISEVKSDRTWIGHSKSLTRPACWHLMSFTVHQGANCTNKIPEEMMFLTKMSYLGHNEEGSCG